LITSLANNSAPVANKSRADTVVDESILWAKEVLPASIYDHLGRISPLQADSYARTTGLYPDQVRSRQLSLLHLNRNEAAAAKVVGTPLAKKQELSPTIPMMRPPEHVKPPPKDVPSFPVAPKGRKYKATLSGRHPHVVPYACQALKLHAEQIQEAIPDNASCIFHVFDRRVNLDALPPNVSMFALLRAWVQDDPYRQVPPTIEYLSDDHNNDSLDRDSSDPTADAQSKAAMKQPKQDVITQAQASTTFSWEKKRKGNARLWELKSELGTRAKKLQRQAQKKSFLRQRQARKSLQAMGITLK
jgi:hypothetical protein